MNLTNIFLIARRDYLTYVMAWGFWLGILATPLMIAFFSFLPILIERTDGPKYYTVIDQTGDFAESFAEYREISLVDRIERILSATSKEALSRFRQEKAAGKSTEAAVAATNLPGLTLSSVQSNYIFVETSATSGPELAPYLRGQKMFAGPVGEHQLHAVIVYKGQDKEIEFWTESVSQSSLLPDIKGVVRLHTQNLALENKGLSRDFLIKIRNEVPAVKSLRLAAPSRGGPLQGREKTLADSAPQWAAGGASFLLWFLIFSVVNYLLMGTIEERSNKIFDTLLTSVKLGELLTGKLLGVLAVTLTLSLVWSLLGVAMYGGMTSMTAGANPMQLTLILSEVLQPKFLFFTVLCFICGYTIFGSLFLALGSLCDSVHEAQTLMSPMLILMMVPLLILVVAVQDLELAVVAYASWVPIFTPFLLVLRLPTDPSFTVLILQTVMMVSTAGLVLWGATKVYRAGAVTGASVGDIWRRMIKGS